MAGKASLCSLTVVFHSCCPMAQLRQCFLEMKWKEKGDAVTASSVLELRHR